MPDDEPVDLPAVTVDAEAIDGALAAFEDACAQLIEAAENATGHPRGRPHLDAVREQLAAVSVPVTSATADALLVLAADARAALQRVLGPEDVEDPPVDDPVPARDESADEDGADVEEALADPDPVLDLAPEPEAVEPPPAPSGYRACTSLPTRSLPHVLAFEDGRWQRASIIYAPDDTLMVRTATARRGVGRRLDQYAPAFIARPHVRG